MSVLSKIFGSANQKYINSLQPTVAQINALESDFEKLSAEELKDKTQEFRTRLEKGESLDDILPEAFALVREASKRTLKKRHFDVQLMGGIVLHQGKIAEMRTGEGKTLVATLPAYLNALNGSGVHIVTVNDYLARRDAVWMGQIHHAAGLTVGCISHEGGYLYDPSHQNKDDDKERDVEGGFKVVHEFLRPVEKREAYKADLVYGTNNEYGFDYLRDNMAYTPEQMAQREHVFAVVDEVDSILIDEARTPLIISAPDTDSGNLYQTFAKVVPALIENQDYNIDEKLRAVSITESGIDKVEKQLGMKNIYEEGGMRHVHHMEQALRAHTLFKRDKDYVVKDGQVIIVDEFTGRLMPGRRWSEGLHQAVEAKEGVKVEKESRTLATITFQNYFRLYKKLSGMTGTAQTSAEEFHKVYGLDVVSVPTNKQMRRLDSPDMIYKTEVGKFKAIAREVKERNEKGQPVLIGTVSIEKNELLSSLLQREGVPHSILNAKNHEKEAEIIAQAGKAGSVTVATNMAGRGVDIILGGNPQDLHEAKKVMEAGGLHVIGTERHEARRIDDQLRGRAGRQGDPGSSQFFVSTEDEVVRIFAGDRLKSIMERLGIGEDDVIQNRFVSNAIEGAQARIEGHNFDIRKYVLEFDDVMNKHRETVYSLRKKVLFSDNVKELVLGYLKEELERIIRYHLSAVQGPYAQQGDGREIMESFKALIGKPPGMADSLDKELEEALKLGEREIIMERMEGLLLESYATKEKEVGESDMRQLERILLLRTIDELWVDHLDAMEYLRDSVRLRAYGQRDPLIEYKIEGQKMYEQLLTGIKAQVSNSIFKVSFMRQPEPSKVEEGRKDIGGKMDKRPQANANSDADKVGRNDPCPCGSGKKYKKCGLLKTEEHQTLMDRK